MFKLVIIAVILPNVTFSQPSSSLKQYQQSIVYSHALAEYIKAIQKNDQSGSDILFVGQYEDLKNIALLPIIQNKKIVLLTGEEEAEKILKERKSFEYINMAELDLTKDHASFAFVAFHVEKSNGKVNWWPKHNCFINLRYNSKANELKLDNRRFEYPYANKYTKKSSPSVAPSLKAHIK
jgi:hypothetical protein